VSSVEIPADPWEIREIPAGDPTRYRGALTRCRKILRGETRVFVTLFSLEAPVSYLSGLNDPYASEVPLGQVLTGWLPSTRGAQSHTGLYVVYCDGK
jgi:hypothetical protein